MIELASFEEPDFDQLIAWIDNETLLTNWAGSLFSFPLTHESLAWYINDTNDLETADALVYKIVEQETGEAIGHISLGSISRKNRSARISRVLIGSNAAKGKGLCKQMMEKVLSIGFNQLNLHRISLGVFDFNTAAIKCYESVGFIKEGHMRDVLWFKDAYWSIIEMSILKHEWSAKQKQLHAMKP